MIKVYWGDSLAALADKLYRKQVKKDIFQREAVLVGSPLQADWLRQFRLFEHSDAERQIFANWEFPSFYVFLNDWVEKALHDTPIGERRASEHPYSKELLLWRIWRILKKEESRAEFASLRDYYADSELRLLELCGSLAQLYDDYQILRPGLIQAWKQSGNFEGLPADLHWQAVLWRSLLAESQQSYTDRLMQLAKQPYLWEKSGLVESYARISLFNLNHIAPIYMKIFQGLAEYVPVELYAFGPCHEYWLDDSKKLLKEALLQNPEDRDPEQLSALSLDISHPLLGSLGGALQPLLCQLLDLNLQEELVPGGNTDSEPQSLLQALQKNLRERDCQFDYQRQENDRSIQIHNCYTLQRQCELAKDLAWRWLDENPDGQPRDIQILVAEYDKCAPLLQALFNLDSHARPLPAVLQKRPALSAGAISAAFLKIIALPQSRFTAAEVFSILSVEPVAANYGLGAEELEKLRQIIDDAYIRWGRDREHLLDTLSLGKDDLLAHALFPDQMTWQRGLDRLMLGYCRGRLDEKNSMLSAAGLGRILVNDKIEGESLVLLESFCHFYDDLLLSSQECQQGGDLEHYAQVYQRILQRFFRSSEHSYQEIYLLRKAIRGLEQNALAMKKLFPQEDGLIKLEPAVMARHFERQCQYLSRPQSCRDNALVIAPLQSMQVSSRKLSILLGLSEGSFPRLDKRSAFDLLELKPSFEDPSLRRQNRLALLEAIMASGSQLQITYCGKSELNSEEFPPSPLLIELRDFLGAENLPIVEQRLNAHDYRYYQGKAEQLFSYSQSNYKAALSLQQSREQASKSAASSVEPAACEEMPSPLPQQVKLEQLQEFYSNPAKFFLRKNLGLFFIRELPRELEEDEIFTLNSLQKYLLHCYLVDMLQQNRENYDENDLHYLQERGLLPLGKQGELILQEELQKVKENFCITKRRGVFGNIPYKEALSNPPPVSEYGCNFSWQGKEVQLSGELQIDPDLARQIIFRPSSGPKGKDWASGWLAHLLANCCYNGGITTFLGSLGAPQAIAASNKVQAKAQLQYLLQVYLEYQNRPYVFSPDAAAAYWKSINGNNAADAAETALSKAEEVVVKFRSPNTSWWEPREPDPDMQKLWGEEELEQRADFEERIRLFWGLEARGGQDND